jgi:hypothetical protein
MSLSDDHGSDGDGTTCPRSPLPHAPPTKMTTWAATDGIPMPVPAPRTFDDDDGSDSDGATHAVPRRACPMMMMTTTMRAAMDGTPLPVPAPLTLDDNDSDAGCIGWHSTTATSHAPDDYDGSNSNRTTHPRCLLPRAPHDDNDNVSCDGWHSAASAPAHPRR